MDDDNSLDLTGVGKLAKAIPPKAWSQIVDTACTTFRDAIAPFTATTSGVGRLITAKFDRLVDAEKVLAAENMDKASKKVFASKKKPSGTAKPPIIAAAVEASGNETDLLLRELWSNLLAQEILTGNVHPEFPRILTRMAAHDAQLLATIAEREKGNNIEIRRAIKQLSAKISFFAVAIDVAVPDRSKSR